MVSTRSFCSFSTPLATRYVRAHDLLAVWRDVLTISTSLRCLKRRSQLRVSMRSRSRQTLRLLSGRSNGSVDVLELDPICAHRVRAMRKRNCHLPLRVVFTVRLTGPTRARTSEPKTRPAFGRFLRTFQSWLDGAGISHAGAVFVAAWVGAGPCRELTFCWKSVRKCCPGAPQAARSQTFQFWRGGIGHVPGLCSVPFRCSRAWHSRDAR